MSLPCNCYICGGKEAAQPLSLKETFTAHSRCKSPTSQYLCQRCFDCLEGRYKQCWYFHPTKEKWSKLWGRNWSWLLCADPARSRPIFTDTGREDNLLEVSLLPTRKEIREWLLNPPEPPFTICLAESGQKHTLPFSRTSNSKDFFPVLLEETVIYLDRAKFTQVLALFEELLLLGFNKSEIASGSYRSDKIAKNLKAFLEKEKALEKYRSYDFFQIVAFVATQDG